MNCKIHKYPAAAHKDFSACIRTHDNPRGSGNDHDDLQQTAEKYLEKTIYAMKYGGGVSGARGWSDESESRGVLLSCEDLYDEGELDKVEKEYTF